MPEDGLLGETGSISSQRFQSRKWESASMDRAEVKNLCLAPLFKL